MTSKFVQVYLKAIPGITNRTNEIFFLNGVPDGGSVGCNIIYFGGDVQDFEEFMEKHRDNRNWLHWSLERTACLLAERFHAIKPHIWVCRPSVKVLQTFSHYANFVHEDDKFTAGPEFTWDEQCSALRHLVSLMYNSVQFMENEASVSRPVCRLDVPIVLVGFSKGCVVLNQLLYDMSLYVERMEKEETTADVPLSPLTFLSHLRCLYFLDAGHNGTSQLWPCEAQVLERWCAAMRKLQNSTPLPWIGICGSPYQLQNQMRPWNKRDYDKLCRILKKLDWPYKSEVVLSEDEASLENHFRVLQQFYILEQCFS